MTQDQVLVLLFKITLITGAVSFATFIAVYTWLAPWWRDELGRTVAWKTILLLLAYIPSILSLFFHLSELSSHIAGWFDVGVFTLIPAVMTWRIVTWIRLRPHRRH